MVFDFQDFAAGYISGSAGVLIGHPFDTTKVQLQTQQARNTTSAQAMRNIWRTAGLSHGYFRGLLFPFVSAGMINSVFFGAYGNVLKHFSHDPTNPNYLGIYCAGFAGALVSSIPNCPVEVVKCTLQAQLTKTGVESSYKSHFFTGSLECSKHIFKHRGFRGFFRGLPILLLRDTPSGGLYWLMYEWTFNRLSKSPPGSKTTAEDLIPSFIAGGLGGALAWAMVVPLDVVKNRYQSDIYGVKYSSSMDCVIKTFRRHGWRVFFRGAPILIFRAIPVNAVTLTTHTWLLHHWFHYEEKMHIDSHYQGESHLL